MGGSLAWRLTFRALIGVENFHSVGWGSSQRRDEGSSMGNQG